MCEYSALTRRSPGVILRTIDRHPRCTHSPDLHCATQGLLHEARMTPTTGKTPAPAAGTPTDSTAAAPANPQQSVTAGVPVAKVEASGSVKPAETAADVATDLKKQGVVATSNTAAGLAVSEAANPATGEHTGDEPENVPEANDSKPIGDQARPAIMTPSGSLPVQNVATTSGPMPAAVVGDAKVAEKLVAQRDVAARGRQDRAHRELTQDQIDGMTKAELRAVAYDRGYDIGEGGTRILRERFRQEMDGDDLIERAPTPNTAEEK